MYLKSNAYKLLLLAKYLNVMLKLNYLILNYFMVATLLKQCLIANYN